MGSETNKNSTAIDQTEKPAILNYPTYSQEEIQQAVKLHKYYKRLTLYTTIAIFLCMMWAVDMGDPIVFEPMGVVICLGISLIIISRMYSELKLSKKRKFLLITLHIVCVPISLIAIHFMVSKKLQNMGLDAKKIKSLSKTIDKN